ncbi:unnamed protein product, partial [Brassica oleracea var. botrytis]
HKLHLGTAAENRSKSKLISQKDSSGCRVLGAINFDKDTITSQKLYDDSAPSTGSNYGDVQTIEIVIVAELSAMLQHMLLVH